MSLTWFEMDAKKADEIEAKRKEEYSNGTIRPPVAGTHVQVNVRVDAAPKTREQTAKATGKKFTIYIYDTAELKPFECFESLHFTIVRALAKHADKIHEKQLSHVLLHIENIGSDKKDKWAVIPLVGV